MVVQQRRRYVKKLSVLRKEKLPFVQKSITFLSDSHVIDRRSTVPRSSCGLHEPVLPFLPIVPVIYPLSL